MLDYVITLQLTDFTSLENSRRNYYLHLYVVHLRHYNLRSLIVNPPLLSRPRYNLFCQCQKFRPNNLILHFLAQPHQPETVFHLHHHLYCCSFCCMHFLKVFHVPQHFLYIEFVVILFSLLLLCYPDWKKETKKKKLTQN